MHAKTRSFVFVAVALLVSLAAPSAQTPVAAPKVTSPQAFFGHEIGADYVLPNYTKFTEFVKKLDAESDRMIVQSIGKTAEGRDQLMAIITAPENFKKLDRYKQIARQLAQAEGLTDDQARALAKEGKAVDLDRRRTARHRSARRAAADRNHLPVRSARPTKRRMRHPQRRRSSSPHTPIPTAWSWSPTGTCGTPIRSSAAPAMIPRLYQKYVGHDNNRDFYMMNQPESRQHQPHPLSRVVSADRLQPPPDRPDRHGDVLAALPRSLQPRLRPAGGQHARPGRRGDALALRRRRQARGDDAVRIELLDLVERRPADDAVLPQPGGPADRDDRQPDARRRSASCPIA